jgi:hypothetical protein
MKNFIFLLLAFYTFNSFAQCATETNIYSFTYDGHDYEVVKENKTWIDAAACAVERGGYLARINDVNEQNTVYDQVKNNAGIDISDTIAPDGGNASYVWIGGNDITTEGVWIWDGDNDGVGDQFWQGTSTGSPVGGLYNNWGNEPDDWNGQDALGLALTQWPIGSGSLGSASQWNDIDDANSLFYIIEYDTSSEVGSYDFNNNLSIFPNPTTQILNITNSTQENIKNISIYNQVGELIDKLQSSDKINISNYSQGIYLIVIESTKGNLARKVFIKE